jgi:O-phosphoseryl-tRNA(Cys) synthetase
MVYLEVVVVEQAVLMVLQEQELAAREIAAELDIIAAVSFLEQVVEAVVVKVQRVLMQQVAEQQHTVEQVEQVLQIL